MNASGDMPGADSGPSAGAPRQGAEGAEAATTPLSAPSDDDVKLVKRYSNRKLYDTARSKYVTLDDIARMVKAGEHIRIIDNETKEDLTSVTLTQIIYEREKAARSMSLEVLRGIIQTSGDTLNTFFDRSVASATKSVESSVTELRQGALTFRDLAARQLGEITESARRFFSREARRAEEFRRVTHLHVEQLEARLEQRVREVRDTRDAIAHHHAASPPSEDTPSIDEVLEQNTHAVEHAEGLRTRLNALAVLVERLEAAAAGREPGDEPDL